MKQIKYIISTTYLKFWHLKGFYYYFFTLVGVSKLVRLTFMEINATQL